MERGRGHGSKQCSKWKVARQDFSEGQRQRFALQIVIGKNQEGKECTYTLELTKSNADWSQNALADQPNASFGHKKQRVQRVTRSI